MAISDSEAVQKILIGSVYMAPTYEDARRIANLVLGGRVGDPDKGGMYPVEKRA